MKPSSSSTSSGASMYCCECRLYTTWLCASFYKFSLRVNSWLRLDFLVWAPSFRSWRKEHVYLMSALGRSQMQTVLVHSSAEQTRKEKGRGRGNKEVRDKKCGMLMAHLTCKFYFWWCYVFILPQSLFSWISRGKKTSVSHADKNQDLVIYWNSIFSLMVLLD